MPELVMYYKNRLILHFLDTNLINLHASHTFKSCKTIPSYTSEEFSGQIFLPHLTYTVPPLFELGGPAGPAIPGAPGGPASPSSPVFNHIFNT